MEGRAAGGLTTVGEGAGCVEVIWGVGVGVEHRTPWKAVIRLLRRYKCLGNSETC